MIDHLSTRAPDPGACRDDQDAQADADAPERDRLLTALELRGALARDVARLQCARLVPDPDCIRVVLVLGLGDECEREPRVERGVEHRLLAERHARDRDDEDPRVVLPHRLAGGRVAEVAAGAAPRALEPEPQALAHCKASSRRTACTPLTPLTTCVTRRSTTTLASA